MTKIAIIGNGIAGITAARHIRKLSQTPITVISGETDFFFSRTALMYIYMGHMKFEHTKPYEDWFWEKNEISLMKGWVEQIDFQEKILDLKDGASVDYEKLIIATGSKSNKFGWPGQDLPGVQGLYSYQDLKLMEENTRNLTRAVIVGGGLIGVEMAEMLRSRDIPVTFLIREAEFWDNVLPEEEASLVSRQVQEHHIDLRKSTELKEIIAGNDGRVSGVITDKGEEIACQFVGLTAGVSPNIDWIKDSELDTDKGILVNHYFETNIPDVYAIGDCAQFRNALPNRRPIEQVWYTGRMHGETVAHTIAGSRTAYQPGVWFNSAKFFDIEYQTYGHVWNQLRENEDQFYWEHPGGRICLKLVYRKSDQVLLGLNVFGIRLRHEVMDRWLSKSKKVTEFLENFHQANFDAEFSKEYHQQIRLAWNQQHPDQPLKAKEKSFIKTMFG